MNYLRITKMITRYVLAVTVVLVLLHSSVFAEIVVGYIPGQADDDKQTPWRVWFAQNITPFFSEQLTFHPVDDLDALNSLMNEFQMVDFAVLSDEQLKKFMGVSSILGPAEAGSGYKLFARPGIDDQLLLRIERVLLESKNVAQRNQGDASTVLNPTWDNTRIVTQLYRRILRRDPDPDGLKYWVGVLDRKEITAEQAADYMRDSEEARAMR